MADANVTSTGGDGPQPTKKAGGGILRKPKYSSSQVVPSSASATPAGAPAAGMSSIISSAYPIAEDDDAGNQFIEDQVPVVRPLIRDVVVERDPRRRQMQKQAATATTCTTGTGTDTVASPAAPSPGVAASAIEGYAPATGSGGSIADAGAAILSIPPDPSAASAAGASSGMSSSSSASKKPQSGSPTVIKSISQLVALAKGTSEEAAEGIDVADIRRRQEAGEEVALETDMAFSCMTEDEYKETFDMAKEMKIGDTKTPGEDNNNQEVDDDDANDDGNVEGTDFEEGCMLNRGSEEPTMEEVFFGRQQAIFGDDTDDVDDSENESRMSEYEGDGGTHGGGGSGFMDFFGADEDDSVGEPEPAPKSFILLWNAMSSWITPETTAQIQEWQVEQEAASPSAVVPSSTLRQPYDLSDIGASRCGGLMSMIKMHLPRALEDLGYDKSNGHVRRLAQSRLANFVRTFDFSAASSPKFDSSLWRALTVVFVDICFPSSVLYPDVAQKSQEGATGQTPYAPTSISQCGISASEYKYLVNSAMKSLGCGGGGGT